MPSLLASVDNRHTWCIDTDAQTTHKIINKNRVSWKRRKKSMGETLEQKARRLAPKHISAFCNFLSMRSEVKITTEKSLDRASTQHCSTASFSQLWQKCKFFFDLFLIKSLSMFSLHSGLFLFLWNPFPLPLKSSLWTDIARYASFCNPYCKNSSLLSSSLLLLKAAEINSLFALFFFRTLIKLSLS